MCRKMGGTLEFKKLRGEGKDLPGSQWYIGAEAKE